MSKAAVISILGASIVLLALWNLWRRRSTSSEDGAAARRRSPWIALAVCALVPFLAVLPPPYKDRATELGVLALLLILWRARKWRSVDHPLGSAGTWRVAWIALGFAVVAPALVVLVTPSRGRLVDLCADDRHSLDSIAMLAREGPWQHPELGDLYVIEDPLTVTFAGTQAPAQLLLPSRDGVLALRWETASLRFDGVVVEEGFVDLVLECRPVQGFQVGPGAASLSLDFGESFSWWSSGST